MNIAKKKKVETLRRKKPNDFIEIKHKTHLKFVKCEQNNCCCEKRNNGYVQ